MFPEPKVLCCIDQFHPQLLSLRVVWVQMHMFWHGIVSTLNAAAEVIGCLKFKLHLPLFLTLPKCHSKTCTRLLCSFRCYFWKILMLWFMKIGGNSEQSNTDDMGGWHDCLQGKRKMCNAPNLAKQQLAQEPDEDKWEESVQACEMRQTQR